ncbi:MAG: hypothetical protein SCALA702_28290 [Melioribacteraceae bacterium]|nr:MAG: hypothetical protein SCALA702_28290 [Melioribacteraceae bacterium]
MMISKYSLLILLFFSQSLFSQSTLFIKYKDEVPLDYVNADISSIINKSGLQKPLKADLFSELTAKTSGSKSERIQRIKKLVFPANYDINQFISNISDDPRIEYVQSGSLYKVDFVPNDSLLSEQWAFEKLGVSDAWDITTGSDDIILGVIDTGIDFFHPDLKNRMFVNSAEDLNNNGRYDESDVDGIDNDGNGFTDDIFGWDFTDRDGFPFDSTGGDYLDWDNYPMDEHGHGTYIAGILGAEANNISGIAGIMQKGKVLNLRAFDPAGYGEEDDVAAAILYAVSMGVQVLNMSFGDNAFSYVLKDVIEYAYEQGVVMVASSGNSGSSAPHYPSGYSQVICVGSSSENDYVNAQSNYGSTLDLVAPGLNILTTDLNGSYAKIAGTSAAAPFVSATAALLLSQADYSNSEIKQIMKSTSVDILNDGWDERSGAGRLDIAKAIEVSAPSVVEFNHPLQDFATSETELKINATILSAYFQSYSLSFGIDDNPEEWTILSENGQNQFKDEEIYNLDLTGLPDTTFTLRLEVELLSGRTLEERVNFHVDHTPPGIQDVSLGPVYYGEEPTILAAFYTDEYAVMKMYYRKQGETEFNFITLDGFTVNNQFFKQLHYGFIPKSLVEFNTTYELYFEAVNLTGLSTIFKNDGNNFVITTQDYYKPATNSEKSYNLPAGDIFEQFVSVTGDINIISNEYPLSQNTYFYQFDGSEFEKLDSLENRRPIFLADMNNDGKLELFSNFARNAYLETQVSQFSTDFSLVFEDSNATFWPITAGDIDNDGLWELIGIKDDATISVKEVSPSLDVTQEADLSVPDNDEVFGNILLSNSGTIADLDNDGNKELWVVDSDGNILGYEATGADTYTNFATIASGLWGNRSKVTTGDYDGDGFEDVAVLLQTYDDIHIAPVYYFYVFNLKNDELNIIARDAVINPSNEFISTVFRDVRSSLRLEDLNGDGNDEMLLFTFPYAYIFEYAGGANNVIYYEDGVNTNRIFIADLDGNGIPEFSLPDENGTKFKELAGNTTATVPLFLDAYSISTGKNYLRWNVSAGVTTKIFRGLTPGSLTEIAETSELNYIDSIGVSEGNTYFYALIANDPAMSNPQSGQSTTRGVFTHKPASLVSAEAVTTKHIIVKFDGKINKTIENLESFVITGIGKPNSISAADDFSYLLTMSESMPTGTQTLTASKLRDAYGSPIPNGSVNFTVSSTISGEEFFISSFELTGQKSVKIRFNLPYDEQSALNPANYGVEPNYNYAESVNKVNGSSDEIEVHFKHSIANIGKDFKITLRDIYSSGSNGIKINQGAGGVIVISSSASDLSDVFVYPNPSNGASKITFANITKRVKIIIFTLNGKRVAELEEQDGDGGLEWDLRDENGKLVGSGIYIYKIMALDETGNETESKMLKFAIIR